MKKKCQQTPCKQTNQVNDKEFYRTEPTYYHWSKKIEGKHIQEQMGNIHVQEPRSHHSFTLPGLYGTDIELVSVKKTMLLNPRKETKTLAAIIAIVAICKLSM